MTLNAAAAVAAVEEAAAADQSWPELNWAQMWFVIFCVLSHIASGVIPAVTQQWFNNNTTHCRTNFLTKARVCCLIVCRDLIFDVVQITNGLLCFDNERRCGIITKEGRTTKVNFLVHKFFWYVTILYCDSELIWTHTAQTLIVYWLF